MEEDSASLAALLPIRRFTALLPSPNKLVRIGNCHRSTGTLAQYPWSVIRDSSVSSRPVSWRPIVGDSNTLFMQCKCGGALMAVYCRGEFRNSANRLLHSGASGSCSSIPCPDLLFLAWSPQSRHSSVNFKIDRPTRFQFHLYSYA